MQIFDTHCDALYKLQDAKRKKGTIPNFRNSPELATNLERLEKGNVKVQCFAIYISPSVSSFQVWEYAMEQIALFHSEIIEINSQMKHIKCWEDIDNLKDGEIGAVLTLEGAEPFGNDLAKLQRLYEEGILSIGLTWNQANLCADGVGESRGAGLTTLGKQVVQLNNEHRVFTDVSHLSVNGFWDVMELADYPIASHSNTRKICDHPRNLSDEQITAMFQKNGLIHVVFYPEFIKTTNSTTNISDIIRHIDHLCSLGGVNKIGFGSDFDGIDSFVAGLENAAMYQTLINELLKYYKEEEVKGFAYNNVINGLPKT